MHPTYRNHSILTISTTPGCGQGWRFQPNGPGNRADIKTLRSTRDGRGSGKRWNQRW